MEPESELCAALVELMRVESDGGRARVRSAILAIVATATPADRAVADVIVAEVEAKRLEASDAPAAVTGLADRIEAIP